MRRTSETVERPIGLRLGEDNDGELSVALWRRPSATGRKLVRSALALGGLRRDTDREMILPGAVAVKDKLSDHEATLATAATKAKGGKPALSGFEIARITGEHARLLDRWSRCDAARNELRTAEELCLDALARDIDAVDLIDAAVEQRYAFRRDLFWLLTALRPVRTGATLLVHSPDARAAVVAWCRIALAAAKAHGWRGSVHVWGETAPGWTHGTADRPGWGPPHDLEWIDDHMARNAPTAALVRVRGQGADLLLGLEGGLHRFHKLAGAACHAWVDLLEFRSEFRDDEWRALPAPPTPRTARGAPIREVIAGADHVTVGGDEVDVPYAELGPRLAEVSVVRLLAALPRQDLLDKLWVWERPVQNVEKLLNAGKGTGTSPTGEDEP